MELDLGRVTPIYRKAYSETTPYELNDIVLYTDGNLYWHFSEVPTTGVPPTDATVWTLAFSGSDLRQAMADDVTAALTAQKGAEAAQQGAEAAKSSAGTYANNAGASATAAAGSATEANAAKTAAQDAQARAEAARDEAEKLTYLASDDGIAYTMAWSVRNGYPVLTLTEREE